MSRRRLLEIFALALAPGLAACGRRGPLERPKGEAETTKKKKKGES